MKNLKKFALAAMAFAAISATSCKKESSVEDEGGFTKKDRVNTTLLVYGLGGENLDDDFTAAVSDAIVKLSEENILETFSNIVVQYKFSKKENLDAAQAKSENWNIDNATYAGNVYRAVFESSQSSWKDAFKLYEGSSFDMTTANSLQEFIKWGSDIAPADNYVLVLCDHGAGYDPFEEHSSTKGSLYDDNLSMQKYADGGEMNCFLSANEITTAIKNSGIHFLLLDYNLCLENSAENLAELMSCSVDYVAASSHVSRGAGISMLYVPEALYGNQNDVKAAWKALCDKKLNRLKDYTPYEPLDFCVTDMSKFREVLTSAKPLVECLTDLAEKSDEDKTAYGVLEDLIGNAFLYDLSRPYIDITDLFNRLYDTASTNTDLFDDYDVASAWNNYYAAAKNAVVAQANNYDKWYFSQKDVSDMPTFPAWSVNIATKGTWRYHKYDETDDPKTQVTTYYKLKSYWDITADGVQTAYDASGNPDGEPRQTVIKASDVYKNSTFNSLTGWYDFLLINPIQPGRTYWGLQGQFTAEGNDFRRKGF